MAYRFEPIEQGRVEGIVCSRVLKNIQESEQYYLSADDKPDLMNFYAAAFNVPCTTPDHGVTKTASNDDLIFQAIFKSFDEIHRIFDRMEFDSLYAQWRESRKTISSVVGDITRNPFYFRIVGMGSRALPSIFAHLKRETDKGEPDHWFAALWAITGVNPVPPGKEGNIREMARAWLDWGRQEGHLNAEDMGNSLS